MSEANFSGVRILPATVMEEKIGTGHVLVQFTHAEVDQPGQKVHWQDAVLLVRDGDAWRIDDVEYLGAWDFKPGARLSEVLQGAE